MLSVNEQSELDILLTVEDPNEYMKNRIKELQEKAKLSGKDECSSLRDAVKGCKTVLEHHQAILDYCFKGNAEDSVKEHFYNLNPEHKAQIDRLWKALELGSLTPVSSKWSTHIIKKYSSNCTSDNEEFVYLKELTQNNNPNHLKQLYAKAIINLQKECMVSSAIATNITSLVAFIDVSIVKSCISFIIDLALEYDKDFDNPVLIMVSLSNINSYLNDNLQEILYALSEHLENSEIGTL